MIWFRKGELAVHCSQFLNFIVHIFYETWTDCRFRSYQTKIPNIQIRNFCFYALIVNSNLQPNSHRLFTVLLYFSPNYLPYPYFQPKPTIPTSQSISDQQMSTTKYAPIAPRPVRSPVYNSYTSSNINNNLISSNNNQLSTTISFQPIGNHNGTIQHSDNILFVLPTEYEDQVGKFLIGIVFGILWDPL